MLNFTRMTCLATVAAVLLPTIRAQAQRDIAFVSTDQEGPSIAYRMSNWKETHFDDPGQADLHLAAVKKLGCEVQQDSHNGHTDVVYRSPRWKSLEVATDQLAHEWESWLKGAGFETIHGHAEDHAEHDHADHDHTGHDHGPQGAEIVAFRMSDWKTTHQDDQARAAEFVALMKGFGCEVQIDEHEGHADVGVRCTEWTHAEFPSHQMASGWEDWLKRSGFEVRHSH